MKSGCNDLRDRMFSRRDELLSWQPRELKGSEISLCESIRKKISHHNAITEDEVVGILVEGLNVAGGMLCVYDDLDQGDMRVVARSLPEWFLRRILSWQGETDPSPELIQSLPVGTSFHIYDVLSRNELLSIPIASRLYGEAFDPWSELVLSHQSHDSRRETHTLTLFYEYGRASPGLIARNRLLLHWLHSEIVSAFARVSSPLITHARSPSDQHVFIGSMIDGRITLASAEALRVLALWRPVSDVTAALPYSQPRLVHDLEALVGDTLPSGQPVITKVQVGLGFIWHLNRPVSNERLRTGSIGQALAAGVGNSHLATPLRRIGGGSEYLQCDVPVRELASRTRRLAADSWRADIQGASLGDLDDWAVAHADIQRVFDTSCSNLLLGSLGSRGESSPVSAIEQFIGAAYGSKARSFVGTSGTSALNTASVCSLARDGEKLLVARDCHVSIYQGLALSGAHPCYITPEYNDTWELNLPLTLGQIESILQQHEDARALVLTSPTYQGLVGDVQAIVDTCHKYEIAVMVDAAHGPHLHFVDGFPAAAEDVGADVVTQSTHKLLGALSQGSVVHFNHSGLASEYLRWEAAFRTTSHSYPILSSIEEAISSIAKSASGWSNAVAKASRLREGLEEINGVEVLGPRMWTRWGVVADPTRVTVSVRNAALDAREIQWRLQTQFDIVSEMSGRHTLLFLIGTATTSAQIADVVDALQQLMDVAQRRSFAPQVAQVRIPELVYTPRKARLAESRSVPIANALGSVSAETLALYPPGQPLIVEGERVDEDLLEFLAEYRAARERGVSAIRVTGAQDPTLESLRICII